MVQTQSSTQMIQEGLGDSQEVDDDDDDGGLSWPQLFADQLKSLNADRQYLLKQEKDIPLIPNTFFKDLLLSLFIPFTVQYLDGGQHEVD